MCLDMDYDLQQLNLQKTSHNLLHENKALRSSLKISFHFCQFWSICSSNYGLNIYNAGIT